MRNGFLGSLIVMLATGGVAFSDEFGPAPAPPAANLFSVEAMAAPEGAAAVGSEEPFDFDNGSGPAGSRIWGRAEFLLWWIEDGNVPPLATTGPAASGGALGAPGTSTLLGDSLNYGERTGGRFAIGAWLDCDHKIGIEAGYFFLGGGSDGFGASSAGAAVLSRPFFNVITGQQDFQVIAFPGVADGSFQSSSSSGLQGADLNLLCNLCCRPACTPCDRSFRMDLLAGPRWLQLNEDLIIAEQLTETATGTTFTVVDQFETRNNFYGGQIGARAEWQRKRCFVNVLGRVALGNTHQEVRISGTTVINEPGAAASVQEGGLLALPTNIGTYSRNQFTVVPEIGMNVGCQVTNHLRAYAGYSFLYWSNVVRPGDQIDLGINPTQLPSAGGPGTLVGPARPAFTFHDTDIWAQGISAGLEFGW